MRTRDRGQTMGCTHCEDLEAIRQLKARYFRLMDTKQWDAWRELFTEDFHGLYRGPHPDITYASREDFVASNREILEPLLTVHHGHMPEITLTGPDSATGIWAMYDRVEMPGNRFEGYGHYHDEYRRVDGQWRIAAITLTRLRIAPLAE